MGSSALGSSSPEPLHWAVAGRLVVTGAGEPVTNGVVVGRGDSIVEIRSDGQIPRGAHVHYAGDGVILPGLIDCHVHLGGIHDPAEPSMMLSMLRASPELFTMWAARDARVTVEAGFTTVRECGARFVSAICAVRDAIHLGLCEGPRIIVGGWLSQTCGHLDRQMTGMVDRIESGLADGPDEIRRQVRQRLREGADFIKVCASNSPIADGHVPPLDEYSVEELRAAVEAAHAGGVKVACHAESERGILNALEAGVDTIEHGTFLTAEAAARMAARGTVLVPTLGVFPALVERLPRWLMKLSPDEAQGGSGPPSRLVSDRPKGRRDSGDGERHLALPAPWRERGGARGARPPRHVADGGDTVGDQCGGGGAGSRPPRYSRTLGSSATSSSSTAIRSTTSAYCDIRTLISARHPRRTLPRQP